MTCVLEGPQTQFFLTKYFPHWCQGTEFQGMLMVYGKNRSLWWLILCSNLTAKWCPDGCQTLSLGVSVRASPEELTLESVTEGSRHLPSVGGTVQSTESPSKTKSQRRGEFGLFSWAGMSIFSQPQTSKPLVPGHSDSDWVLPLLSQPFRQ